MQSKHQQVSFIKSLLRIIAGIFLISRHFFLAGSFFILAELLGVLEEIV
jgi:hypothetical protein